MTYVVGFDRGDPARPDCGRMQGMSRIRLWHLIVTIPFVHLTADYPGIRGGYDKLYSRGQSLVFMWLHSDEDRFSDFVDAIYQVI